MANLNIAANHVIMLAELDFDRNQLMALEMWKHSLTILSIDTLVPFKEASFA